MTQVAPVTREEVRTLLARYGDRSPEQVDEHLGSLELTWLISQLEEQREIPIDLTERQFEQVQTVDDAVRVLSQVLREAAAR